MALTRERAQARSACIKKESIMYDYNISLEAGNSYEGLAQLTFELTKVPENLPLDFKYKEIRKIIVNGSETELQAQQGFILLDVTKLKEGVNQVAIAYRNNYNNDGSGCVSFVDVDGKQYLYTQFESYYANRVFPIFDQPDLKAKMRLNAICPSEWKKILSNEYGIIENEEFNAERYIETAKTQHVGLLKEFLNEKKGIMSLFPQTKLLPSYLFCFVAGDYQQLKIENRYKDIPMSIYCIESLFKYLKELAPFIFEITIQSMKFFESFFGYPFSFNKYDQIFVHEYKWGAMENAGIVTFNDVYVWKEKVSTQRMLSLANTISHELAHHWFGNLVTMKWWDDLWLNESFADFISHFCLEKIRPKLTTIQYESSFASFLHRKGWGYHEDQRVTTHPIRGPVPNTSVAESIFDGITYAKGAATMKQFLFIMQQENFSKGLSAYFTKFAFDNATLQDFIDEMAKHFTIKEFTLDQWRQLWLEKASLNMLEARWNPEDKSQNAKIAIQQSPFTKDHPTLRPHKIKIGLFRNDFSVDPLTVLVQPTEETIVEYDGSNGYSGILLNYEDYSFVKNVIDPVSLKFFSENLEKISDILSRTLIWRTFFDMVKDGKMTSAQYVDIIEKNISNQTSDSIFQKQFQFINASISAYTPSTHRQNLYNRMFNVTYELLKKTDSEKANRIVILKDKLTLFAQSQQNIHFLLEWKNGKIEDLKNHSLSIGQQWRAVVKAYTLQNLSIQEKEKIFQEQKAVDSSDTAKLRRQTCDALKATKEEFQKMYESFKDPKNELSTSMKEARASGWAHSYHKEWMNQYKERYFKDIVETSKVLSGDHLELFIMSLAPISDDLDYQIAHFEKIKLEGQKFDKINTEIRKVVDDLKRREKAYHLFLGLNPMM